MAQSNIEIERKYLLKGLPPQATTSPSVLMDQGYIPGTLIRERVRRITDGDSVRYVRTMKLGKGMARQEFEEETTRPIFEALWSATAGRRLQKRRHYVPDGDLTWEVDAFTDRELLLAEIEIPTVDHEIVIPGWLAPFIVRDVTEEKAFGNSALAR